MPLLLVLLVRMSLLLLRCRHLIKFVVSFVTVRFGEIVIDTETATHRIGVQDA